MYSAELLDHFEHPRNVGEMADADAEGEDENPVCGDRLHVWLRITEGRIERLTWQAEGCAAAMAAASALSELVRGLPLEEARRVDREALAEALGGVPARKSHAPMLAIATLRKALAELSIASVTSDPEGANLLLKDRS